MIDNVTIVLTGSQFYELVTNIHLSSFSDSTWRSLLTDQTKHQIWSANAGNRNDADRAQNLYTKRDRRENSIKGGPLTIDLYEVQSYRNAYIGITQQDEIDFNTCLTD